MESMVEYYKACLERALPLSDPNKLQPRHRGELADGMNLKNLALRRRSRELLNYKMARHYGITMAELLTGEVGHTRTGAAQ
jgi:hypothetical protein